MKCIAGNCVNKDHQTKGRIICVEPDDDGWICESCWQHLIFLSGVRYKVIRLNPINTSIQLFLIPEDKENPEDENLCIVYQETQTFIIDGRTYLYDNLMKDWGNDISISTKSEGNLDIGEIATLRQYLESHKDIIKTSEVPEPFRSLAEPGCFSDYNVFGLNK